MSLGFILWIVVANDSSGIMETGVDTYVEKSMHCMLSVIIKREINTLILHATTKS